MTQLVSVHQAMVIEFWSDMMMEVCGDLAQTT